MRRTLFVTMAGGLLLVAACGGGGTTATLAPGATAAPGATTAPPPGGAVDVAAMCAGSPTFSLNTPSPSFASDTALEARFPTEVDGEPVTGLQSSYWLHGVCYYGQGASEAIQRFAAIFPPATIPQISQAYGEATISGEEVTVSAFRIPGADASQIFSHLPDFLVAVGVDASEAPDYTVAQASIGGKNAWVVTDPDGDMSYHYASGDTVFTVDGTEEQAGKFFAATQ